MTLDKCSYSIWSDTYLDKIRIHSLTSGDIKKDASIDKESLQYQDIQTKRRETEVNIFFRRIVQTEKLKRIAIKAADFAE